MIRQPGFGGWRGLLSTLSVGLFVALTWTQLQETLAAAGTLPISLLLFAGYVLACFILATATALILGWAERQLRR